VMSNLDQAKQAFAEMMRRKRCDLWPECSCHKSLLHWQGLLSDDGMVWEFDHLQWADTSIFLVLSCLERHCPNRKVKAYAAMQLLDPWWDRQRRGEKLTREWAEQREREQ
jgi:hypothetical protein